MTNNENHYTLEKQLVDIVKVLDLLHGQISWMYARGSLNDMPMKLAAETISRLQTHFTNCEWTGGEGISVVANSPQVKDVVS